MYIYQVFVAITIKYRLANLKWTNIKVALNVSILILKINILASPTNSTQ